MANTDYIEIQNFIGGKFEKYEGKDFLDIINPATSKCYGKLPNSDSSVVDRAVQAAKKAFKGWSKTPKQERSRILNKIADIIESRIEELAQAESRNQGKPVSLARTVDIPRVVSNFRFFAGAILHHTEMASEMDGTAVNYTVRTPVGVCGLISPWNLPLYLLTWKIAPALAVGNTIVCKPSEFTSVTAWMLASIMNEAGVPAGVCNMVFGGGFTAGKSLVVHPDVPLISFTGGTVTGEHIIRDSAPHYKKLYLELGGKNPVLIFNSANLAECIPTTVRSSFSNQGEICLCGSRIFVQEGIYEEFLKQFVEAASKLKVGDPKNETTNIGALVSDQHRQRVESYIQLATEEGGKIVLGGNRPTLEGELNNGFFLNPTIIANLSPSCRVQQEEIFGPVVGISVFKTEEEAIQLANDCKYGLSAVVWSQDVQQVHRVSLEIETGTVWVNCWMVRDLRMPFGGVKHSGIGRASGSHSIDFYTEQKTVCIKL